MAGAANVLDRRGARRFAPLRSIALGLTGVMLAVAAFAGITALERPASTAASHAIDLANPLRAGADGDLGLADRLPPAVAAIVAGPIAASSALRSGPDADLGVADRLPGQ
jgi:hypothetical protein